MALNKQSGNMYGWVTHTWNPVRGCKHDCSYCYVKSIRNYDMTPRLVEKEFRTNLGKGNFIFVGSTTDMFGDFIPDEWIRKVLEYCDKFDNKYLFQTKNPERFNDGWVFPERSVLGTTIETTRDYNFSKAPPIGERVEAMEKLKTTNPEVERMVTIEPIMDFDLAGFLTWIGFIEPNWVNVGADSKNSGLPEPSLEKIEELIDGLKKITDVRVKSNLSRIKHRDEIQA